MATEREVTKVLMEDGRNVEFAGKRKMVKEILVDEPAGKAGVRFDFVNGMTRTYWVPPALVLYAAGHGMGQKEGDYVAGAKDESGNPIDVDDMVLNMDELYERIQAGQWNQVGEGGGGVGGGSIIIKAMMELLGKTAEEVRKILDGQIAAVEATGQKLTKQKLYQSLRNTQKLSPIIQRLEAEKAAKQKHLVDGEAILATLAGASPN